MDLQPSSSRWAVPPLQETRSYLHPGQMLCSSDPIQVTTILGSCVAVCLWDPTSRIGGMVHYMLAEQGGSADSPRYGNSAIPMLVASMQGKGARLYSMQAKVFGGGCVLKALTNNLGEKNVQVAHVKLAEFGVRIVQEDTLGSNSRKVTFNTATGTVVVQTVRSDDGR